MGRVNVAVDRDLVTRVMQLHGLRTKRAAIDFALRQVAGRYDTRDLLALKGIGWEGDLQQMRSTRFPSYEVNRPR